MSKEIKLSDLVKDKNVLLVGNSKSLLEKDNATLIDSYEFVIRFNLAVGKLHNYNIGNKCDAWIYAMCRESVIAETFRCAKIKPKVCVRYGKPYNIGKLNITLDVNKNVVRQAVGIQPNLHPSTGVVTTWYMLNKAKPKSLTLIGFDSFKKSNFYTAHINATQFHSEEAEDAYLKQVPATIL